MPDKKKSAGADKTKTTNVERRMTPPQAPKSSRSTPPAHPLPSPSADRTAALPDGSAQLGSFEAGMKLFHARKLKEARDQFVEAAAGRVHG